MGAAATGAAVSAGRGVSVAVAAVVAVVVAVPSAGWPEFELHATQARATAGIRNSARIV
jgi:hypothetical protein